jgi:hypothetical protein
VIRHGVAVLFLLCCLSGCGDTHQELKKEANHLRPLAVLYGKYLAAHRGQPPADEKIFREFILSLPPNELASANVTDANAIFTSTRDQKPYILIFTGQTAESVVAYEQEGVAGNRYIATALGDVREVSLAELQQLVPGAK